MWQLSVGTAYGHGDLRLEGADGGLDGLVGVPRVDGSFFCCWGGVVFFFEELIKKMEVIEAIHGDG